MPRARRILGLAGALLLLVGATVDGKEVLTQAVGDSTLLLILVDERKVGLDDKLSTWLPDVPNSDRSPSGSWRK